jgi:methyl-accepting chemotaxis protein
VNLRARLVLGYGYLVALVVASGAGAALGFQRLGQDIDRALAATAESTRAGLGMLTSLERQDHAVLALLLGDRDARHDLEEAEASFQALLERARAGTVLAGKAETLAAIATAETAYREAQGRLLAAPGERPLTTHSAEVTPLYLEAKAAVRSLLELNQEEMVAASRGAERRAATHAVAHGLLVGLALISLAWLSQALGRDLLSRLAELKAVSAAIAGGDRRRRAAATRRDELGLVAEQLNAVLDRLLAVEAEASGRLAEQRQLVLGLLAACGRPASLLALDGSEMAASLETADREAVQAATSQLPRPGRASAGAVPDVEASGRRVSFRLLVSPSGRPLAWLATVAPRAPGESAGAGGGADS